MVGAQYVAITQMNECFSRGLRVEVGIKIGVKMVTPLSFHMIIGEQLCYIISCWTNGMFSTVSRRHIFQACSRTKSFILLFIVNTFWDEHGSKLAAWKALFGIIPEPSDLKTTSDDFRLPLKTFCRYIFLWLFGSCSAYILVYLIIFLWLCHI